jgi:hypothetical protein
MYLQRPQAMKLKINVDEPLPKEKSEKDIADLWKNLYHTQNLPYTK